jgi:hypothetical protein
MCTANTIADQNLFNEQFQTSNKVSFWPGQIEVLRINLFSIVGGNKSCFFGCLGD